MIIGRDVAPCGACRKLVPISTGCTHWRPDRTALQVERRQARRQTVLQQRKAERKALADEFRGMLR